MLWTEISNGSEMASAAAELMGLSLDLFGRCIAMGFQAVARVDDHKVVAAALCREHREADDEVALAAGRQVTQALRVGVLPGTSAAFVGLDATLARLWKTRRYTVMAPAGLEGSLVADGYVIDSVIGVGTIGCDFRPVDAVLRSGTQADVSQILAMYASYANELCSVSPFVDRAEFSSAVEAFRRRLAPSEVVVAETQNGLVGFAEGAFSEHVQAIDYLPDGPLFEIYSVYVDTGTRHAGVGRALIEAVVAAQPEVPVAAGYLVGPGSADQFWRKMGLSVVANTWEKFAGGVS